MPPSIASAPELQKNIVSANDTSVSRLASFSPLPMRNRLEVCQSFGPLLGERLDQGGVAMAQRVHGDAGGKVQVTSAVRRVEIVALSAFEHDVLATVRRHHSRNHDSSSMK